MLLHRALRLGKREVVAFVGGGGKTTAMFRLAAELVANGQRVVTTTTTRLSAGQTALAPIHLVVPKGRELPPDLDAQLAAHSHVLITGPLVAPDQKVSGVEAELVAALAAHPGVDAVLIEADGSRTRPLKAPAGHEPVVPPATTLLVPVAGADVLGRPLDETHTHRPELIGPLTGLQPGQPVTAAALAVLLAHPQGGRKNAPPGARVVALINKLSQAAGPAEPREAARLLLGHSGIDSVLLGDVAEADPVSETWGRAAAVILAAGSASRMGELKQVLPWGETTLVGHAADVALASEASEVIVVVGSQAERVVAALGDRPVRIVTNPDWAQGQSTSVRAGLAALRPGFSAAMFLVADQPFITPALLDALLARHRATLAPIVSPRVDGRRANPALFDRAAWPDFAYISGDAGGRGLFDRYRDQVAWVDWDTDIGLDVDTPEDYRALGRPGQG